MSKISGKRCARTADIWAKVAGVYFLYSPCIRWERTSAIGRRVSALLIKPGILRSQTF